MNKLIKTITVLALSLGITFNVSAQATKETITGKTAPEIVKLMGTGWNLGNTLDANSRPGLDAEISWKNPKTTQEMIDAVKEAGFNTVRIPVSWGTHTDYSNDMEFKIDDQWLTRVKEVVDYCFNNNLFVILNIHHDTNKDYYYPSEAYREQSETYVKEVWSQVAATFSDYDQHLIFETLNEPRLTGTNYEWWFDINNITSEVKSSIEIINNLNQIAVDAIRDNGSDYNKERMIMCPGYCASMDGCRNKYFKLPADKGGAPNRIAISVHAYAPYELCLGDLTVTKFENSMKSGIEWHFKTLDAEFAQKDVAVVIGETSISNKNNLEDRLKWVECFYGNSKKYGIPCVLWDNNIYANNGGEAHGYLNRKELIWYADGKEVVNKIMNTLGIGDSTGVNDIEADIDINITFNDNELNITSTELVEYVALFDLTGNLILESTEKRISNLGYLKKGIYIVYIDTKKGKVIKKVIKTSL